ncbi:proteasome stabiliser-domain-containing protein [Lipomyces oligophaga]|uniref:proteasome stabiliser-domain-containing protein n=1 Tax=Lipomyces oligophaga TaxID=45792 RepID=UPI0034CDE29C
MASAELALVNKVEMRIALASTDAKLESLLRVYLAPLLLKLASPHEAVRNKVVSICSHINARISSSSAISLPVESLLAQFRSPNVDVDSTLLRNFCLIYIRKGITRMDPQKQADLLPELVKNISTLEPSFQKALFGIILSVIPQWQPPDRGSKAEDDLRSVFGFDTSPADAKFLSLHFTSTILLDLSVFEAEDADQTVLRCPGVSPAEFEFLTLNSKSTFTNASLTKIKKSILIFSSSALTDQERFWPILAGYSDKVSEIAQESKDLFKKIVVDYEDEEVVNTLYDMALGKNGVLPVNYLIRIHILQLLCKSSRAANTVPQMMNLITKSIDASLPKERAASIEFVTWVTKMASNNTLEPYASSLIQNLRTWIEASGWPIANNGGQDKNLRGFAYETIGSLMKRSPQIAEQNLTLLPFLFDSLSREDPMMRSSVHESLSTLIPILPRLSSSAHQFIKDLVLGQMKSSSSAASNSQYLALRYAISALSFSDVLARYVCLLGLDADNRSDVIAEAQKGLNPYWFRRLHRPEFKFGAEDFSGPEYAFPDFDEMLQYIRRMWESESQVDINAVSPSLLVSSMKFLRQILIMKAFEKRPKISIIDDGWDHKLDEAVIYDTNARSSVIEHLQDFWFSNPDSLSLFLATAFTGFSTQKPGVLPLGEIWLEILSLGPASMVSSMISQISIIENLAYSHNAETRLVAGHALGIIYSPNLETEDVHDSLISRLMDSVKSDSTAFPRLHGSIATLGYVFGRLKLRGLLSDKLLPLVEEFWTILMVNIESQSISALKDVSILAILQLGIYGASSYCSQDQITNISEILMKNIKQTNSEKSMQAYGALYISASNEAKTKAAEEIFTLHDVKQVEFLMTSGEALAYITGGWDSTILRQSLDIQGLNSSELLSGADVILGPILDRILELAQSTKPSLKKASCIWLLSLVQFCGHLPPATKRLELIHFAFVGFLGDRDEIVQESASRGLGLVYEQGDKALKEDLVRSLVQSFTSDSRTSATGRVSAETQLFEPGLLNTGEGSVSTYKDIMSLAAEAGDPSLIYRFMSLASSSAIWSTRKGAAFGLGSILTKTSLGDIIDSNPKLGKTLIPKLYRYRFDPNLAVQQSMKDIWNALVLDSSTIVEAHFDDILSELLKRMGDKEWRVRQASCAALQDLLDTADANVYQGSIEQIWFMSFRALDDIKESVRVQAISLCRGLSNSLVRMVEVDAESSLHNSETSLQELLPFLLGNSGLQSQAKEVQGFALETLLKLVQKGGTGLRPFIPTLIEELLGLLSTMEPQAVNYIALNADKYGLTSDAIDATRLAGIRASPMMDAIEKCVDLLDDATMKNLVPKLQTVIRKSVGLPSKVASSRVLVTMVVRHFDLIRPYSGRFIKSCMTQLGDRNDTVVNSYASAAGYLCRLGTNDRVLELVTYAQKLYFEGEDERARLISGSIINALSKHASDKFMSLASSILPFVYIAKHDNEKAVKEIFEAVWIENTGGSGAIKLYFGEIMDVVDSQLESQRWTVRQNASLSLADASNLAGSEANEVGRLFTILIKACLGKSWEGKDKVVEALCILSEKSKEIINRDVTLRDKLYKVFVTEAKRNNVDYRKKVVKYLEKFCSIYALPVPSLED